MADFANCEVSTRYGRLQLKTVRGQVHHIFDVIIAMGSSGLVDVPEHKAMGDDLRTSVISINEVLSATSRLRRTNRPN